MQMSSFFLLENALSCSGLLPLEKTIQRRNIIEKSLKKVYEILLQARDIFLQEHKNLVKNCITWTSQQKETHNRNPEHSSKISAEAHSLNSVNMVHFEHKCIQLTRLIFV